MIGSWLNSVFKTFQDPRQGNLLIAPLVDKLPPLLSSLRQLASDQLTGAILGDDRSVGLDLSRGLDLEARLQTSSDDPATHRSYIEEKLTRLLQLRSVSADKSDVFGRDRAREDNAFARRDLYVNTQQMEPWIVDFLASGSRDEDNCRVACHWSDSRHLVLVDSDMLMTLHDFPDIPTVLADAYRNETSVMRHIDANWEDILPDPTNVTATSVATSSLRLVFEALCVGAIVEEDGKFFWADGARDCIGTSLVSTLVALRDCFLLPQMLERLQQAIAKYRVALTSDDLSNRQKAFRESWGVTNDRIAQAIARGEATRLEKLERQVLLQFIGFVSEPAAGAGLGSI